MPTNRKKKGTPNRKPSKAKTDEQVYATPVPLDEEEAAAPGSADEPHSLQPSSLSGQIFAAEQEEPERGTGPAAAGQAGSLQNVSRVEYASTESVAELLEEGQTLEAAILSGVEKAATDHGEVPSHEPGEDSSSDSTKL